MSDEIKDTVIQCEKDVEIRFDTSFKWILRISIFLTGFLSLSATAFLLKGITQKIWLEAGMNYFMNQFLVYLSIIICFVALVSISRTKRPFSKILIRCIRVFGLIFVVSAFLFPHIDGYSSGFRIMQFGNFTLIDGTLLLIGLLGLLFSKLLQYGFKYQKDTDMTV